MCEPITPAPGVWQALALKVVTGLQQDFGSHEEAALAWSDFREQTGDNLNFDTRSLASTILVTNGPENLPVTLLDNARGRYAEEYQRLREEGRAPVSRHSGHMFEWRDERGILVRWWDMAAFNRPQEGILRFRAVVDPAIEEPGERQ